MNIRGSLERLAPVMMTAMTSFIYWFSSVAFWLWRAWKRNLYPLSVVLFGGMLASTILDQLVTPACSIYLARPSRPSLQGTL